MEIRETCNTCGTDRNLKKIEELDDRDEVECVWWLCGDCLLISFPSG